MTVRAARLISIIPLAGPDIVMPLPKPLTLIEGRPLLAHTLGSRPWVKSGELTSDAMIFVLKEGDTLPALREFVNTQFPGCRIVVISEVSRGALLSALAGASLIQTLDSPIVVDLVDILYSADFSPSSLFETHPSVDGILPYFESDLPKYSYMEIQGGRVTRTMEKQVISTHASAGTYFFRNLSCLLKAAADSVAQYATHHVNGNLFLCPCFNGLISPTREVLPIPVTNVVSKS